LGRHGAAHWKALGEKFEAFEALYASVSETITTMEKERAGEDEHE
jgi:hypothetical protein